MLKRGAKSLLNTPPAQSASKESQREAKPLLHMIPPPFPGEGDKGGGLTDT